MPKENPKITRKSRSGKSYQANCRKIATPERCDKFIDGLRNGLSVLAAAKATGISHGQFYRVREKSQEFAKNWDAAYKDGTALLEHEAQRRAVQGTNKPVFYLGKKIATVTEYSDTLLIFLLKARDPRFRDNFQIEATDELKRLISGWQYADKKLSLSGDHVEPAGTQTAH
jgi:hypothetical protein